MAAPVIRRELENPLDASKEVNAQGARLERLGYDQQVRKGLHECSFFIERQGRRCKVTYRDGVYRLPEAKETLTRDEMSRLLDVEPEGFSPNVALRPVVQQSVLPAAAYVAGPGEVAYWAQLGPLFERHRVQPSIVYPRARAVVTRDKERHLLDGLSLRITDMTAPEEQLMDHALARMARNPARRVLERRRAPLEDYMESLRRDLREADDRGGQMAEALQRHASRQLDRMERALRWADDVQVEAARKRVVRLQRVLAPWRRPQERVYTPYSFVFQWGRDFIERVLSEIDIHSFEMNEVRL
jgi:uncharacterized protein YllA (UPF0747 family)